MVEYVLNPGAPGRRCGRFGGLNLLVNKGYCCNILVHARFLWFRTGILRLRLFSFSDNSFIEAIKEFGNTVNSL